MNGHDLTGKQFGRLLVVRHSHSEKKHNFWMCNCECGQEKLVRTSSLIFHGTKSCGCIHKEQLSQRTKKHGKTNSAEYRAWCSIRRRCNEKAHPYFQNYGGRGIKVCNTWEQSFENFYADMGDRPSSNHSIDRIDVNGDYEPSNCKWSTHHEQAANRRPRKENKSGQNGVSFSKTNNKWIAAITVKGTKYHLGKFVKLEEAILARKEAELKYWGKSS